MAIGWCEKCTSVEIRHNRGNTRRIDLKECVYMYISVTKIKEKKLNASNPFVADAPV